MSFSGKALLALHLVAVIFALGPGTAAIMSTPRYIRKGDVTVVRYLYRTTRIYAIGSVLVLVFGLILAQVQHDFAKWWISVSITLYIVAAVLLVLIVRDQRKAIAELESAAPAGTALAPAGGAQVTGGDEQGGLARSGETSAEKQEEDAAEKDEQGDAGQPAATPQAATPATPQPPREDPAKVAAVERARISSLSGIVALIWLVSLVLMVWK